MPIYSGDSLVREIWYNNSFVKSVYEGGNLKFTAPNYFTVTNESGSTNNVSMKKFLDYTIPTINLEYRICTSGSIWQTFTPGTTTITLSSGQSCMFRASSTGICNTTFCNAYNNWYFSFTNTVSLSGDITTLLTKYGNVTDLSTYDTSINYQFAYLFRNGSQIVDVSNLILTPTILYNLCYCGMFLNCTNIKTSPILPAITLAPSCYSSMFRGCTNLSQINVYFTSWGTSNITYTDNWLSNVASSGTFTCPQTLTQTRGDSYIPSGWTITYND